MSVYVDDSFIEWRGTKWCHLQADTLDELHEFAERIGLRREWFQPGSRPELAHYDVSESVRKRAISLGAIEESWRSGAGRARRAIARATESI